MSQGVDTFGCIRNTIKLASGAYLDIANPDPNLIDLESIAHGLSMTCRYGGQCPEFYSVAEHSVLCTVAAREAGDSDILRDVLLHDAAEAFIGDIPKPIKLMLPDYQEVEAAVEAAIRERFGLSVDSADRVKKYDRAVLKLEKQTMWPEDSEEWEGFSEIEAIKLPVSYWTPDRAKRSFLSLAGSVGLE